MRNAKTPLDLTTVAVTVVTLEMVSTAQVKPVYLPVNFEFKRNFPQILMNVRKDYTCVTLMLTAVIPLEVTNAPAQLDTLGMELLVVQNLISTPLYYSQRG